MKFKVKLEHSRGKTEATFTGNLLREYLRDIAENVKDPYDFLIHLEVDRIDE